MPPELPEVHLFIEKQDDGRYKARVTGLCVVCHDSSGAVARATTEGLHLITPRHEEAVITTAQRLFELTFGPFTHGPLRLDTKELG